MPLKFSSLWKRSSKKTPVTTFQPESDAHDSPPASPKHIEVTNATVPDSAKEENWHDLTDLVMLRTEEAPPAPPVSDPPQHVVEVSEQPSLPASATQGLTPAVVSSPLAARADEGEAEMRDECAAVDVQEATCDHLSPAETLGCRELHQVHVKASLDEILTLVESSFDKRTATSLASVKWDKRVEALKGIVTVLKSLDLVGSSKKPVATKGLHLRDSASCWRTACQVLHHSLRDKVMPVRLESHELFRYVCEHVEHTIPTDEVKATIRALLDPIIAMLCDSNLRLHKSARSCVLLCAHKSELVGLKEVLAMLHVHLLDAAKGRERARLSFGIIDTVNYLLGECIGSPWERDDVAPFVIAGVEDAAGARSRTSAVTLAVTMRASCGAEAMHELLEKFRPGVRATLVEKFAQFDEDVEDDDDDNEDVPADFAQPSADAMAGLFICGNAIRRSAAATPKFSASPLPGAVDEEENFMDRILEDTGAVFGKSGCVNVAPKDDLMDMFEEEFLTIANDMASANILSPEASRQFTSGVVEVF